MMKEKLKGLAPRPYTDAELHALMMRVHGTARDKGWWQLHNGGHVVFANGDLEDKLVLIASEIGEAFETYRNPLLDVTKVYTFTPVDGGESTVVGEHRHGTKPEGVPIELADAYIRVLDLMWALECAPAPGVVLTAEWLPGWKKLGKHLFKILRFVSLVGNDYHADMPRRLTHVLVTIEAACHELGIDLKAAVQLKADYNETRPQRHGGKRA